MKILCFGDSNTYGYDPRGFWGGRYDSDSRWPDLLAKHCGNTIINAGSNGRCIPHVGTPLPPDWETADQILIMLGTNDLLQGLTPAEAAAKTEVFLTAVLPRSASLMLIAPPPMKRGTWVPTDDLVTASRELAAEYAIVAQRLSIPFVDTRNWDIPLTFDGVHFTEDGHRIFARCLMEAASRSNIL